MDIENYFKITVERLSMKKEDYLDFKKEVEVLKKVLILMRDIDINVFPAFTEELQEKEIGKEKFDKLMDLSDITNQITKDIEKLIIELNNING